MNIFLCRESLQLSGTDFKNNRLFHRYFKHRSPMVIHVEHCHISASNTLIFFSLQVMLAHCTAIVITYLKICIVVVRMFRLTHLDCHPRFLHELASCQRHRSQHAPTASMQHFLQNLRSSTLCKCNLLSKQHLQTCKLANWYISSCLTFQSRESRYQQEMRQIHMSTST